MKLLLVLNGESYRSGSQMTRTRGTGNYYERQMLASMSHINLINAIKYKYDIDTDVIINTYSLNENDDNKLINIYKSNNINIVRSNFHKHLFNCEHDLLNNNYDNTIDFLNENYNYDYIFYVRIDMYLKKYLLENISFKSDKIIFSHIDSNIPSNGCIPVYHGMFIIPRKFFYIIHNRIIYNTHHEIYNKILKNNISRDNFEFMIDTLHVCSSDLGWNPLYIQVGRFYKIEYNIHLPFQNKCNYYYDNQNNTFVLDHDKTINYWNNYIRIRELDENNYVKSIFNK
jgi:hypothetical protein